MRLKTFIIMAIVSLTAQMTMVSCSTDDGESTEKKDDKAYKTIVLGSDSYTKDGYFDGLLYYKITSNSDMSVILTKAEKTAQNVEIPKYVIINGEKYAVTEIRIEVFEFFDGLKSIIIPNSVTSIGSYAFYGCSGLTSLTIPNSVTSIGNGAFEYCSGLTSLTIPNSVTSIGESAFSGCSGLTSLTIPNSVTSIGESAFRGCSGLTSLTIPNSVTSIGNGAFYNCSGLTSITVDSKNTIYDSRNNCNAIIRKSDNTLLFGCKNTIIPNSVTSIGNGAFYKCSGLTSMTIPNSVTSIGESAFYGCSGLTSLTIPNSVTSIGYRAFSGCMELKEIYCNWLYPQNIKEIDDAFNGTDIYGNCIIYVPKGTLDAYKSTLPWNRFTNIVEV